MSASALAWPGHPLADHFHLTKDWQSGQLRLDNAWWTRLQARPLLDGWHVIFARADRCILMPGSSACPDIAESVLLSRALPVITSAEKGKGVGEPAWSAGGHTDPTAPVWSFSFIPNAVCDAERRVC